MNTALPVLTAAILLLTFVHPAAARPGTPSSVAVSQCPGRTADTAEALYGQQPKVCVVLTNTAHQRVSFDAEFAVNGVPADPRQFKERVDCFDNRTIGCIPGFNFGEPLPHTHRTATVRRGDPIPPEGFFIRDLAFDTKYCFRFRARDEDGVVSAQWTNWDCVTTKPQPKAPEAPTVSAKFFPAGWRSETVSYTRDYIVVEWSTPSDAVSRFSIQISSPDKSYGNDIARRVSGGNGAHDRRAEFEVAPLSKNGRPPDIHVVVCAHNYSGQRCSRPVSTRPVSAVPDMARESAGSSFGSKVQKLPIETAPIASAVPAPAPTRPVARATVNTGGIASVRPSAPAPAKAQAQTDSVALVSRATSALEYDIDRPGSDYFRTQIGGNARPEQCGDKCAADASCKAWTFVKAGIQGPAAMCYLKNAVPKSARNGCCVSGVARR